MFDFAATLPHWVNRLSYQLREAAQAGFVEAGLDLAVEEWAVLMVIWGRGPQRMTDLAATTLRDRTTVTRIVDRMVKKGLVTRRASEEDRRVVAIAATEAADAMRPQVMAVIAPLIAQAMQGIDPQAAAITLDVLRKISANLEGPSSSG